MEGKPVALEADGRPGGPRSRFPAAGLAPEIVAMGAADGQIEADVVTLLLDVVHGDC